MGGGAWPFLVGGVNCLVNSVKERDLSLLKSVKYDSYWITSWSDFVRLTQGSLRQQQVCDVLRCSGLHAHYTDAFNEFITFPEKVGYSAMCIVMVIDCCNY